MNQLFKSTILAAALTFSFSTFANAASVMTSPATKDVAIGFNEVYVPGGFDSSSEAYVVANGLFPNGCYKWKNADVKHVDTFNHEVESYATVSQGMCIMVLVPFTKEIRLGKLSRGSHTLKFLNGDGTYLQKTMSIE